MKVDLGCIVSVLLFSQLVCRERKNMEEMQVKDIDGKDHLFKEYLDGKKAVLIVNVASKCGYTDVNYKELQQLYVEFKDKGLEIVGFPCNQFGKQEPGDTCQITEFTEMYDVTFPVMDKVNVNGNDAHELFKYLKKQLPGTLINAIKWNFTKFLIVDGKPFKRFGTNVNPLKIRDTLLDVLKE